MFEHLLAQYDAIVQRYSVHLPIPALVALLKELQELLANINNVIKLSSNSKSDIDERWITTQRDCNIACRDLAAQIEARRNSEPISSPVQFLDALINKHRSLIRWIDKLEDTYGENFKELEITLPRIVVVGEENVGKSSVLERIAGLQIFPRAEGICTRLPFQLRLHHLTPEKLAKKLGPDSQSQSCLTFESEPGNFYTDPNKVAQKVSEITLEKTGGKGVKDEVVILNIHSTAVTDLTLIDLPGIINAHRPGEPSDINETTLGIVQKYIKDEDTIILAVIPATQTIGNSQALGEIQRAKALDRTVAVLTRVDLTTARDRIEQKILGTAPGTVDLPHGYIGVINHDTELSPNEQINEQEYFKAKFPQLWEQGKVGCAALTQKLNVLLDRHIREVWAKKIKTKIMSKQTEVNKLLDSLGPPLPDSNVKEFFQGQLTKFCGEFRHVFGAKQSLFFMSLVTKYQEATFSAKKANNNNKRDIIFEVLTYAESFVKKEIADRLDGCRLTRFSQLCDGVNTLFGCTQEAKTKTFEFLSLIADVDSVSLPSSVGNCSSEPEKNPCVICQSEIPSPDGGGVVTLQCSPTASHYLHVECFMELMKKGLYRCPSCRAPIPSKLEKMARSGGAIDPVLLFILKAIAKYYVPAVLDRFPVVVESEYINNATEETVRNFLENSEVTNKRRMCNEQADALRGALMEVMKFTD